MTLERKHVVNREATEDLLNLLPATPAGTIDVHQRRHDATETCKAVETREASPMGTIQVGEHP
jgi:hypothetical protein